MEQLIWFSIPGAIIGLAVIAAFPNLDEQGSRDPFHCDSTRTWFLSTPIVPTALRNDWRVCQEISERSQLHQEAYSTSG